jgi:hypothetical protein
LKNRSLIVALSITPSNRNAGTKSPRPVSEDTGGLER